jgi:hypothetical protein
MVRIAVCISGQPRAAKETFHMIMNNIIRPNNADVFIHMNYDSDQLYMEKSHTDNGRCNLEPGIDKWVIDNYKPVRYLVEKPRDFKNQILGMSENRMECYRKMNAHKQWNDDEIKKYAFKQLLSMYYSIYIPRYIHIPVMVLYMVALYNCILFAPYSVRPIPNGMIVASCCGWCTAGNTHDSTRYPVQFTGITKYVQRCTVYTGELTGST